MRGEHWTVTKPAVKSQGGMIASQHYLASAVGAEVLAKGGNAVDAAVAAAFAIGVVEPWMSGIGGGGVMLVAEAGANTVSAVDFTMVAPIALDPNAYPLVDGSGGDLFGWPAVVEDRNVMGSLSMAVPGHVAGMALALERFGSRSWAESLAPAVALADGGLSVDWYATTLIASNARDLSRYPSSRAIFLDDGFVPVCDWSGTKPTRPFPALTATLSELARGGPDAFYRGPVGERIVADVAALGGTLSVEDLRAYQARVIEAPAAAYRDAKVFAPPGLTAGPTLRDALARLESRLTPQGTTPDAEAVIAQAQSLRDAYEQRLTSLGDTESNTAPACTTHMCVVDGDGMAVSLTQTLLSLFGSNVVLPETGILMNNGIMWFDPRPGRPNSIRPGARPLTNMCPTIIHHDDGTRTALGASGGRRIMPAVFQLTSALVDFRMDLESAFHHPRIDASGGDILVYDPNLATATIKALTDRFPSQAAQPTVYPAFYACPSAVQDDPTHGVKRGCAHIMSPWASARGA